MNVLKSFLNFLLRKLANKGFYFRLIKHIDAIRKEVHRLDCLLS